VRLAEKGGGVAWLPHARSGGGGGGGARLVQSAALGGAAALAPRGASYGGGAAAVRWAGAEARAARGALRWLPAAFAHSPPDLRAALAAAVERRAAAHEVARWVREGGAAPA